MSDVVLRVQDVRKQYGGTTALRGVSIAVSAGEIYGLVGPNGAGKTTLVRGVTGTTPVEGTVALFGDRPTAVDRGRIGVLPQSFAPAGRLTARELLRYYAGLYETARSVQRVLDDVGLTAAADTAYEHLSGGQRRRLCVGTALVNDPELLVVDEPTTGIDPAGRRTVHRLVQRLADDGTAVLLTSHSMPEVERLADRVGLLADGRLIADGPPAELIDSHAGPPRLTVTFGDTEAASVAVDSSDAQSRNETTDTVAGDVSVADDEPTADERTTETADELATAAADELATAAADELRAAGYTATAEEATVTVTGVEPTEIAAVVETLGAVPVQSITWREPTLEDAYLRLTDSHDAITEADDALAEADDATFGELGDAADTQGGPVDARGDG